MATRKLQITGSMPYYVGKVSQITLAANKWTGEGPWTQNIAVAGGATNSKVDVQVDAETMGVLGGTRLVVCNDRGAFVIYAVGVKPEADLNVQVCAMGVDGSGIIWGNPV